VRRSTALATAALATAAILSATAGAQQKPPITLTLSAAPNPVVAGSNLTLAGKLTGDKLAKQKITLRSDPFPYDAFANVGTATTNATGDFSLIQQPAVNTRYQARKGNDESAVVTVLVRPKVGLRLGDHTPAAGQRVRFAGRVCPEHDGVNVAIQRHSGGRFRTVGRAKLRDIPNSTCSSYSRVIRVGADSRYRTVIRSHADHARGISPVRRANVS
jgi:hypothetical protein